MPEPETSLADGRYRLLENIGCGGMATVYRGFDERLQVTRAVKILNQAFASKSKIRARFEAEARTMAVLDHTNIVRVYDVGSQGDTVYIVMELVEGQTLLQRIEGAGPIPPTEALQITRDMVCGLQAAHAQTIVHRDIKPHNILLSNDGRVRITDFGIARSMHLTEESFTKTGAVMGTWAFMAPEQRVNSKGVDCRADIYGTGATLFAMVTQRTPMDLFAADLDPVMLRDVPDAVLPVIRKATRYQADERYSSAEEMLEAIDSILQNVPTSPQTIRSAPPTQKAPEASAAPEPAEPPAEATFLPEDAVGLLSTGSIEPQPATPPPPIVPGPIAPSSTPEVSDGYHSGTLLPEDEVAPELPDPEATHRNRMVKGLMAILVMVAIGAVGKVAIDPKPTAQQPATQSTMPTKPEPTGKTATQPTDVPAEVKPKKDGERPRDDPPEAKAPEVELTPPADKTQEEPTPKEEAPAEEAPKALGEGLRLLSSPPRSGSVGDVLHFSARIPAASIPEHRGYSVRMSYRATGGSYRRLEMRREGKVWRGSVKVTAEMAAGLQWCMFAKPDPGMLAGYPKLTAVACKSPRRVPIEPR